MGSIVCMNDLCGASLAAAGDYKKGWALRSGDFANLCDKCGTAYEQLAFCELFHLADTGWQECTSCGKMKETGMAEEEIDRVFLWKRARVDKSGGYDPNVQTVVNKIETLGVGGD